MEITQQIRDYAARRGVGEQQARDEGMEEKSAEFRDGGGELYR
jgi:phosphomethylpyrimidine synthase